ncbi:MAG: M20/M25/M40 family metallo-hydrolase, partial [Bacteroidota bacterium]|nr:M20/M25/M40 family metallo-hydrolase [Bacteroidota bacterium]
MNVYETISNQVEKERENIINFLIEFINQKSINPDRALPEEPGGEKLCQEWLRDQMAKMDVFNKIDIWELASNRPNLVGVIGEEKKTDNAIMFNGHVDVVPVTKQQYKSWTIGSPWKAERIGDRIYGRGASDMKSGITAFLWAAKILAEAKFSLEGSLITSINVGEESSNFDIGSRAIVRRGYRAPLLINAEPTNLIVCPATKGAFFFKISIPGQGAHVA